MRYSIWSFNLKTMCILLQNNSPQAPIVNIMSCTVKTVRKWSRRFSEEENRQAMKDLHVNNSALYKVTMEKMHPAKNLLIEKPFRPAKHLPGFIGASFTPNRIKKTVDFDKSQSYK